MFLLKTAGKNFRRPVIKIVNDFIRVFALLFKVCLIRFAKLYRFALFCITRTILYGFYQK